MEWSKMVNYSFEGKPEKTARAAATNSRVSHKSAIEITRTIKGMKLDKAKAYLMDVLAKTKAIPFKKFTRDIPHKPGAGMAAGRYPVKAAEEVKKLLENAEANADNKGLDTKKLVVKNASANKGGSRIYRGHRSFGRRRAKSANIQITVEERA